MRPSALERMRLDAEVGESARTLAEAAEAFRLCLELERDCRVAEEASRRSALHDEGLPTTGLTVAVLERWRREREAAHALIASRLAGLKAATERAEVALRDRKSVV